jgi:hypothetical protein
VQALALTFKRRGLPEGAPGGEAPFTEYRCVDQHRQQWQIVSRPGIADVSRKAGLGWRRHAVTESLGDAVAHIAWAAAAPEERADPIRVIDERVACDLVFVSDHTGGASHRLLAELATPGIVERALPQGGGGWFAIAHRVATGPRRGEALRCVAIRLGGEDLWLSERAHGSMVYGPAAPHGAA